MDTKQQDIQSYLSTFPRQKLARRLKTEEWGKKCIDSGIKLKSLYSNTRRSSRTKKIRNYNLINGKFNKEDLGYELQPVLGDNYSFPASLQYRDVVTPIFQTLFGEEAKRGNNFIVRAINEDAISEKEVQRKNEILKYFQEYLTVQAYGGEISQETPPQLQKYVTYSYQDMREQIASHLLNYYQRFLRFDQIFQKGWEDALVAGEEIYATEQISNEPILRNVNTLELYFLLPHNTSIIDDADLIYEETFMSVGKIIDDNYELLTSNQISDLENNMHDSDFMESSDSSFPARSSIGLEEDMATSFSDGDFFDSFGNMRVSRVTWKSRRKVGSVKFTDDNGEQQEILVDEAFKVPKDNPDIIAEWFWINEYWEGTRIGKDIYINIQPKKHQFRRMDNISACKSGYWGTVYNCNNTQSVSLMDRLVPWIYLYITMWYRTELLMAANQGKVARINIDEIPEGWEISKWLYYMSAMKIAFVSSFNEGKKGSATGKLVGTMNQSAGQIDLELGNSIQHHISILGFIESKLQQLSGVTPPRMGDISPSEAVGNVQTSITTSATVTEPWFQVHNWTKQRAMEGFLEVAKSTLQEGSKKMSYITDDMATTFFEIDGNEFANAEYGVFLSNSSKDLQALEILKQLTHAAIQTDKVQMSDIADILSSNSIANIKNKLQQSEEKAQQIRQQTEERALQYQEKINNDAIAASERKMANDNEQKELDRQNKVEVATISAFSFNTDKDIDNDGIPDMLEISKHTEDVKIREKELALKDKGLNLEDRQFKDKLKLEAKKIESQERVARIKKKTPTKK